ncbi:MAG TPA: FliI/YscN family ATPase [Acidimicrobiia bacterium]|nr:FliI/YscN family ATPase [Acidimicrobiia bacterium]
MNPVRLVEPRRLAAALEAARPRRFGRVERVVGLHLEVSGLDAAIGDAVVIFAPTGKVGGEVVALHGDRIVCMPFGDLHGLRTGAPVWTPGHPPTISVGRPLLGRVLDGLGQPIDGRPLGVGGCPPDPGGVSRLRQSAGLETVTVDGTAPHPLLRANVDRPLPLGVRALDTLIPCGRGQRLGIFAGSGVGKSSLLSMIARGTEAQVSVLALVGERGREVREFLERDLGPEGLARSVVVVATSDQPALVRLRAAFTATRIAEWFRDQGMDVVLMMDSLTRFAMAQREVGLSAGEPPATRGYPPSVFSLLPRLLERAGAGTPGGSGMSPGKTAGSITGLYTVLVDGDDMDEPIADCARSILDGHVVLSRRLASAGHFPTIEVLDSISRVSGAITTPEQKTAAVGLRRLLAAEREVKDLVEIGAYVAGTNADADRALALSAEIRRFLCQDMDEVAPAAESWARLRELVA